MQFDKWQVEWILMEKSDLTESAHVFLRKSKGRVLYTSVQKHLHPPRGSKGKPVRVLYGK